MRVLLDTSALVSEVPLRGVEAAISVASLAELHVGEKAVQPGVDEPVRRCHGARVDASEIAEDMMAFVPLLPGAARAQVPGATLSWRPGSYVYFGNAARVRTTRDDVEELVATARAWFGARGRTDFTWWLGPHAAPDDIGDLLQGHGAKPHSVATAMAADGPAPGSPAIETVAVTTREQFVALSHILDTDGDGDPAGGGGAASDSRWDEPWASVQASADTRSGYLAYLDGKPVAAGGLLLGDAGMAMLAGGATMKAARGTRLLPGLSSVPAGRPRVPQATPRSSCRRRTSPSRSCAGSASAPAPRSPSCARTSDRGPQVTARRGRRRRPPAGARASRASPSGPAGSPCAASPPTCS